MTNNIKQNTQEYDNELATIDDLNKAIKHIGKKEEIRKSLLLKMRFLKFMTFKEKK
jgi:hypothetical protein